MIQLGISCTANLQLLEASLRAKAFPLFRPYKSGIQTTHFLAAANGTDRGTEELPAGWRNGEGKGKTVRVGSPALPRNFPFPFLPEGRCLKSPEKKEGKLIPSQNRGTKKNGCWTSGAHRWPKGEKCLKKTDPRKRKFLQRTSMYVRSNSAAEFQSKRRCVQLDPSLAKRRGRERGATTSLCSE